MNVTRTVTKPEAWIGKPCSTAGRGFSLIELLVVIGIVLVGLGVLLPTLGRTQAAAKSNRALMAVQQCGVLLQLYAASYKDTYPLAEAPNAVSAAFHFYEPLVKAGLASTPSEIDPDGVAKWGAPNIMMSMCLVYDADRMMPGRTEPESQRKPRAVRTSEVTNPAAKGSLCDIKVHDGAIETHWCCIEGSPRGPVGFCDGSAGLFVWRDLLPDARYYEENGIGRPVLTTWSGYRGRDRLK